MRVFLRAAGIGAVLIACLLVLGPPAGAQARFNVLQAAPPGAAPPADFTFPDLEGRPRRLSEWRGKVVLLAFFATWCPLCNEEMPKLTQLQKRYEARGFTVLAVSIDQVGAAAVKRWAGEKGLGYPVLHDARFSARATHNVRFVPTLYLLDRKLGLAAWTIGSVDWGGKEASALLDRLLAAPSASGPAAARSARLP